MTKVSQDVKTANQHKTKTQYHNTCPYTLMPNRCSPCPRESIDIKTYVHCSQNQREGGREGGKEEVRRERGTSIHILYDTSEQRDGGMKVTLMTEAEGRGGELLER